MRCSAENRLDAHQQLTWVEWFANVVVSPQLEADDAIHVLAPSSEHADRDLGAAANLAADRQAVLAGQHQIEHDEIHARTLHDPPHLLAIRDDSGAEFVLLEILPQQGADLTI